MSPLLFDGPPDNNAIRKAIEDVVAKGAKADAKHLSWVRRAAKNNGSLGGDALRALKQHNLPRD